METVGRRDQPSSMAGILMTPSVDAKILERRAIWKAKRGDAKFKDILRQRCRRRIKEKREQMLFQFRGINTSNLEERLANIIREEFNQFVKNFESGYVEEEWDELNWETPKEALSDQEERLLKHFDGVFDDEAMDDMLEEVNQLVCPLCLKGFLMEFRPENAIICNNCSMKVSACVSLPEIHSQISRCLNTHSESRCSSNVSFFALNEDETQYLYVTCSDCGYMDIVG